MIRGTACLILVVLICALAAPAMAVEDQRYSYITVHSMEISVENNRAVITINYTLDEGIRVLVLLLGKSDLKSKLLKMVNYDNAYFIEVGLDRAVLVVDNASDDYGGGIYWFPSHSFNVVLPALRVRTPQTIREYTMTREFDGGIGHFQVEQQYV
jgi:hypothetical protein